MSWLELILALGFSVVGVSLSYLLIKLTEARKKSQGR